MEGQSDALRSTWRNCQQRSLICRKSEFATVVSLPVSLMEVATDFFSAFRLSMLATVCADIQLVRRQATVRLRIFLILYDVWVSCCHYILWAKIRIIL